MKQIFDLMPSAALSPITPEKQNDERQFNPEKRERLNNYKQLDYSLWSEAPEVDAFINVLGPQLMKKVSHKRRSQLKVLLMNLLDVYMEDPLKYVGVHRGSAHYSASNLSRRYNPARISRLISEIIDSMAKLDLIEYNKGYYNHRAKMGYVSKIKANEVLINLMTVDAGIQPEMIGIHPDKEVIILKQEKVSVYVGRKAISSSKPSVDYSDDSAINSMRDNLRRYNDFTMASARVKCPAVNGARTYNLRLYRVFNNNCFHHGGRFYGAFYQNLKKIYRKQLLINGAPVAELDFKCLHGALLYAKHGLIPPEDIYAVDGYERDIVKLAFLRLLNNKGKGHAINGLKEDLRDDGIDPENLPGGSVENLYDKLEENNEVIASDFYKAAAYELQNIDSQIADYILIRMTDKGICCLPVHDSFIVPEINKEDLEILMIEAFQSITGTDIVPRISEN